MNYSSIFPSQVQNLTVFSIVYMIRIRFFGPGELIQNGFSAAQYMEDPLTASASISREDYDSSSLIGWSHECDRSDEPQQVS